MTAALRVDRAQVLAYRAAATGLDRRGTSRPGDLAVLDLGVQGSTPGSIQVALAARTTAALDDDRLSVVWAARGAPHLHRRAELAALAAALWPVTDADATARIVSPRIRAGAQLGVAAFAAAAEAFRTVVTEPMHKGDVSTGVSVLVPPSLTFDCPPCGARHISGALFQQAGLAGGVRVETRGNGTVLAPIDGWAGPPAAAAGVDALLRTYLRLLGPATPVEAAKYLGTTQRELRRVWPDELAEVDLAGRAAWLPAERLAALRSASPVAGVRLLPPMDPWLQARDRDLLAPDKTWQAEVWRAIGNPGVLLVNGEIAGTWRAKAAGRSRLDLTVTGFGPLALSTRSAIEREAAVVAAARDAADVRVAIG
jgi:hypothetical protein